jgi:hypothetical protein
MGLFGNGYPGSGNGGNKCDYCGRKISKSDYNNLPHLGNAVLTGLNRYFCSSECLKYWRDQNQFYGK